MSTRMGDCLWVHEWAV